MDKKKEAELEARIREILSMSEDEQEEFFEKWYEDHWVDPPDDFYDDMPEGCKACGGPYPDCTSSCKMFDD